MASGGLSHFVVDQELDQAVMGYLRNKDVVQLSRLPRERLESGNSEIRSWITVGGATEHLDLQWYDYVPCYRTPAGTGVGMCFAEWG